MTLKLDDLKNNNTKNIDAYLDVTHTQPSSGPPRRLSTSSRGVGRGDAINVCITQLNDYTCTVYVRQNKYGHVLKT